MASNKVRSALIHKMLGKLHSIGGEQFDFERDPLGKRYEVNKHNINISPSKQYDQSEYPAMVKLAQTVIEQLKAEGWVPYSDQWTKMAVKMGDAIISIDLGDKPPKGYPLGMSLSVR